MNSYSQTRRIFVRRDPFFGDRVEFLLRERITRDGADSVAFGAHIEMRQRTPEQEGQILPPTFTLNSEEAQGLMDELWGAGFRPTEGTGSAGALAATQRHLEDFRALVFKTKPKDQG